MKNYITFLYLIACVPSLFACSAIPSITVANTDQVFPIPEIVRLAKTAYDVNTLRLYHQDQKNWAKEVNTYHINLSATNSFLSDAVTPSNFFKENVSSLISNNDISWDIGSEHNNATATLGDTNREALSTTLHSPDDLLLRVDHWLRVLPIEMTSKTNVLQWKIMSEVSQIPISTLYLRMSISLTIPADKKDNSTIKTDILMPKPITYEYLVRDQYVSSRYQEKEKIS